jgi:tRNA threonylcarbamoyladenosine modification (KEOPS) complex Cgi121 subunit
MVFGEYYMKPFSASFAIPYPAHSEWKILSIAGVRDTKSAVDTLKKISSCGGFWQAFSPKGVASYAHLAWAAYSTVLAVQGKTTRYSSPELEFLSRVSGMRQWEKAKDRVGMVPGDWETVLVWVGPSTQLSSPAFLGFAKKWGLKPRKVVWGGGIVSPSGWGLDAESFALEESAMVELA